MTESELKAKYLSIKTASKTSAKSPTTGAAILAMAKLSVSFLTGECDIIKLVSKVPMKEYFTFSKKGVIARPANKKLFISDVSLIDKLWAKWINEKINAKEFAKLSYTIALAPCLAMEIFDRQNKKGPATYFEWYIGHLFSNTLDVNPTKKTHLQVKDRKIAVTMDFLFEINSEKTKIHLPVKMSTRERVVQAWAHQRLLNSAFGEGAYKGIMVLFSETKLNLRSLEVVEICVPDQWLIYQALLAKMEQIYYFDPPERYLALMKSYPDMFVIRPFGDFFKEGKSVLRS